ncbi:hypothetical protein FYJ91_13065 [Sphingomonas montanisoli]|uniref:Uncharacterized protein n=1 Tax=Sphingomonas montanisoli TaxID=2606412 RepID=A0A5D9C3Y1_9SPHN|nr:hypothetical protein FYJ91_13065 [Sphingomonas montanisoli]
MSPPAVPPRNGEGDREAVEGAGGRRCTQPGTPSTMLRMVPLPVPGRINLAPRAASPNWRSRRR